MIKQMVLVGLFGLSAAAQADCTPQKLAELHLIVENDQILIPAKISGQPVNALFGTGFPSTILTSSAASQLGLTVARTSQQSYFDGASANSGANMGGSVGNVSINGGMVSNDDLGLADIAELILDNISMKNARAGVIHSEHVFVGNNVAAVLGSDVWRDFDIDIDLSHNLLTIYRANGCSATNAVAGWGETPGYNVVDLSKSGPGTAFEVEVNHRSVSAILDSGTPHSSLTEKAAARLGLDRPESSPIVADAPPDGALPTDLLSMIVLTKGYGIRTTSPNVKSSGQVDFGPQVPKQYWLAHVDSLKIDQEVVSPLTVRIVPSPRLVAPDTGERTHRAAAAYEMLLGVDFIRSHRILISHSQNKVYFSYIGGQDFAKP